MNVMNMKDHQLSHWAQLDILAVQEEQECNIVLGSWTYHGNIINLTLFNNKENMDLTNFYNSFSPYVVTRHMEGTKVVKRYSCCEEPYLSLNFRSNQSKLIVNVSFDQGSRWSVSFLQVKTRRSSCWRTSWASPPPSSSSSSPPPSSLPPPTSLKEGPVWEWTTSNW